MNNGKFDLNKSANLLLRKKELFIKNTICKVVPPLNKIIHLTIHRLDAEIPNESIAKAFLNYGKVLGVDDVKSLVPGLVLGLEQENP